MANLLNQIAPYLALLGLAILCGIFSLIVVWRRWAFLSEGIAHAGFGGAGTAWLLACAWPGLDNQPVIFLCITSFCLLTGLGIGALHRQGKVQSDTAIGALLVGGLAWGFVGQQIYLSVFHTPPAGFQALLFGQTLMLTPVHAQLVVVFAGVCLVLLGMFRRSILLFCFDPELAQTSGVRTGMVHYLLILLITLAIILGVPMVGSVLITALLILPGATAMLISRRLTATVIWAVALSVAGAACGIIANGYFPMIPQGPVIVLSLLVIFLAAWAGTRKRN